MSAQSSMEPCNDSSTWPDMGATLWQLEACKGVPRAWQSSGRPIWPFCQSGLIISKMCGIRIASNTRTLDLVYEFQSAENQKEKSAIAWVTCWSRRWIKNSRCVCAQFAWRYPLALKMWVCGKQIVERNANLRGSSEVVDIVIGESSYLWSTSTRILQYGADRGTLIDLFSKLIRRHCRWSYYRI